MLDPETLQRVAARLEKSFKSSRFATGHEPEADIGHVFALLDAAAEGRISLLPKIIPFRLNVGPFGFRAWNAILVREETNWDFGDFFKPSSRYRM
jgi:hypothetical protein